MDPDFERYWAHFSCPYLVVSNPFVSNRAEARVHGHQRFAPASAANDVQPLSPCVLHHSPAHVHDSAHYRAKPSAVRLFQSQTIGAEKPISHHSQHVIGQHADLIEQFVRSELAGRRALQIKLALEFSKILLAGPTVAVESQDVFFREVEVCPYGKDCDFRRQQKLPMLFGSLGHFEDQSHRPHIFDLARDAAAPDGLAWARRMDDAMGLGRLKPAGDAFPAQVVLDDEVGFRVAPVQTDGLGAIKGAVEDVEESGFGELFRPLLDFLEKVDAAFAKGVCASGAQLRGEHEAALEESAHKLIPQDVVVRESDAFALGGVRAVQDGGVHVDPNPFAIVAFDDAGFEVEFLPQPQGAARQGVEQTPVLAHLLKTLPERGLGGDLPQPQGPGEKLIFAKGPDMVEVGPAEREQPAHGAQDVAFLDGLGHGFSVQACFIDRRDPEHLADGNKAGVPHQRFIGKFQGHFGHAAHLSGEIFSADVVFRNIPEIQGKEKLSMLC